jgi:uncharacterized LabA/DUF88 family protein
MSYAAVFIDGGYLDWVLRDEFASARVDYEKLVKLMVGENFTLLRAYYYNCLPYQSSPPTEDERIRFAGAQRFFNVLRRLGKFEVREGRLAYRGQAARTDKPILVQKRVDTMMAVDLVLLSVKQRIDRAVLCTGDSDFLPATDVAKNEGVIVHLWHGKMPHRDLWDGVDERTQFTQELIDGCLRP